MEDYEISKPIVKNAYHSLSDTYVALYDLVECGIVSHEKALCIQKHIRDVLVQIDDFILEMELGLS